ncbi:MAG: DUF262 domain-containing protein [Achromobacter sp.]|uniref:DUF262 domain-containing protein n=1 Tax=Achromobacter sp. TaxID=134375 RepID=UPI002585175A|nr:DUF262 domain-containing protein [Achromobacter sp.]MCW0207098.1 DUF262 domain-containing protein [Achromobacter sp.]
MNIRKLERSAAAISIASFHEQNQIGKFNYSPPYQRRSVWSDEKQSYFIDSILRNFPIPPIFLHRKIDPDTGKTSFDVIDGKQRLTAIARFIANEIPAANEYGPAEEPNALDGAYFRDLSSDSKLSEFRSAFWKYDIPVEYIDPSDVGLIEDVFDRLNRNGEPLKGQELRNAQYHSKSIMGAIDQLISIPYMKSRLEVTDVARMEDKEFCSECLLSVCLRQVIGSNQGELDRLYEAHQDDDFSEPLSMAAKICADLEALDLDYNKYRIGGVSHLYGLWSVALILRLNGKSVADYKDRIHRFYIEMREGPIAHGSVADDYRKSMTSRTKEKFARVKRVNALLAACGESALSV